MCFCGQSWLPGRSLQVLPYRNELLWPPTAVPGGGSFPSSRAGFWPATRSLKVLPYGNAFLWPSRAILGWCRWECLAGCLYSPSPRDRKVGMSRVLGDPWHISLGFPKHFAAPWLRKWGCLAFWAALGIICCVFPGILQPRGSESGDVSRSGRPFGIIRCVFPCVLQPRGSESDEVGFRFLAPCEKSRRHRADSVPLQIFCCFSEGGSRPWGFVFWPLAERPDVIERTACRSETFFWLLRRWLATLGDPVL